MEDIENLLELCERLGLAMQDLVEALRQIYASPEISRLASVMSALIAAVGLMEVAKISLRAAGWLGEPIPTAHKIAIIGLPASGKTTLITALFELVQLGVHVPRARLHGANTIALVNKNIALLNSGQAVGPTSENDIFVFRFSYVRSGFTGRTVYDVEIADFPGEYSERIERPASRTSGRKRRDVPNSDYALFRQEFFSWIASSRSYVFVVDLAAIYCTPEPGAIVADMIGRIRTSWQVIEDAASERGLGSPRARRVLIVYTKLDALLPRTRSDMPSPGNTEPDKILGRDPAEYFREFSDVIRQRGTQSNLASEIAADSRALNEIRDYNDAKFEHLYRFFQGRSGGVRTFYASMIIRQGDKLRLGVRDVLQSILP